MTCLLQRGVGSNYQNYLQRLHAVWLLSHEIVKCIFICYSIFDNVPDDLIVESFYNYPAADEKDTLKQSIVDFKSCDEEELLDILRSQCHQQPTAKNMKDIIFQLARQEMITLPHLMAYALRPDLSKLHMLERSISFEGLEMSVFTQFWPVCMMIRA